MVMETRKLHETLCDEMKAARDRLMRRCLGSHDSMAYMLLSDYDCFKMDGDEETGRMIAAEVGLDRMCELLRSAIEFFEEADMGLDAFDAFLTMKHINKLIEKKSD